jgi:urea transport system permease protein
VASKLGSAAAAMPVLADAPAATQPADVPPPAAAGRASPPLIARLLAAAERWAVPILALLLLVVAPLTLDSFRLPLAGKYLSYAFCAVGVVMIWA